MEFRHLQYFCCVVSEESFTKAAKKINLSQPALSRTIKNLEKNIGAQLLVRTNKQFVLTEIGEEVYREGKKIVEGFDDLDNYIRTFTDQYVGKIIIGLPPVIGTCLLPSFLGKFNADYPNIETVFKEEGANVIGNKVYLEEVDVGIVIKPIDINKYDVVPIVANYNVVIVNKSHPFASKKSITTAELQNEPLLLLNNSYTLHHSILRACRNNGFEPNIKLLCHTWDLLLEMVALNQGVTILPMPILNKFANNKIVGIPLTGELMKWDIVAITKKNKLVTKIARIFIKYMKDYGYV